MCARVPRPPTYFPSKQQDPFAVPPPPRTKRPSPSQAWSLTGPEGPYGLLWPPLVFPDLYSSMNTMGPVRPIFFWPPPGVPWTGLHSFKVLGGIGGFKEMY